MTLWERDFWVSLLDLFDPRPDLRQKTDGCMGWDTEVWVNMGFIHEGKDLCLNLTFLFSFGTQLSAEPFAAAF